MQVAEYNDQKIWNNFVAGQKQAQFLHSWEWGELQEKEGRQVRRMALTDEGQKEILAVFLLIKTRLARNYHYFYTPRGPIFKAGHNTIEAWNKISEKIKELASKENIIFWRLDPIASLPGEIIFSFKEVLPVQPKNTLILDLKDSEENLLKKMHPKMRYNIKLAQKKGVLVREAKNNEENVKIFWELLNKTAKRQDFILHKYDHYLNIVNSSLYPKLFFASYEGRNIAANLNISYGDTSVYLHGASSDELQNLKPASLLQWEAMREAKKAGYKYYDFWGINKGKTQNSKLKTQKWDYKSDWEGITRFKKSFGGEEINFPGTFESPINKTIYKFYKIYKKILKNLDN